MDHQKSKSKNTILNFLPRATSSVSFQNPPIFSPSKHNKPTHKSHLGISFSGPLVSGDDPRRKIKNNSDHTAVYEPTSPTVSCMGQVKCKYTNKKPHPAGNKPPTAGKVLRLTSATPERTRGVEDGLERASKTERKKKLGFKKLFGGRKTDAGKKNDEVPMYLDKAPSLGTMKMFSGDRSYDFDEEDVVVPSSAPVVIRNPLGFDDKFVRVAGNFEPRKEINLWKRRTMRQPKPLLLHNT